MISHRCRYKGRGSVLMRFFTSSIDRCAAARVILAIPSLFWFQSSPPLFYHSTRIGMRYPASPSLLEELERIEREEIYQRRVFFIEHLGFCQPTEARKITFAESLVFEKIHEETYTSLGYGLIKIAPDAL